MWNLEFLDSQIFLSLNAAFLIHKNSTPTEHFRKKHFWKKKSAPTEHFWKLWMAQKD